MESPEIYSRPVTIIVLAWNRWDLTSRCLETIREHGLPPNATVLVVDNGSTDETPSELAKLSWVRVLRLPRNLGFVRGNNAGIASVPPDHDVILLNNDVEIIHGEWVEGLQRTVSRNPDAGIVGARLLLPDGRLLHAGTYILPDTLWGQQIGALEREVNQYARDRKVEGIVFACAYITRRTIEKIGVLSTDFQSYFEDTDYCLAARDAGLSTYVAGEVTLVHHEHGATAQQPGMFEKVFRKSRKTFTEKWKKKLDERYQGEVLWKSILNFPSGYAMSCREFLRSMDRQGIRASYRYAYGKGSPFPVEEPEQSGDYLLNVLSSRTPTRNCKVGVVYGQGDVFERGSGSYRIGYTMLEVDGFPAEWVRQANQMDEVWVPSEFNREAFIACGVRKPVHVMPLGVDIDHFHPRIASHRNPDGDFVFLCNFEWGERKYPELLLTAFNRAFRHDEPVALVCKVINKDGSIRVAERINALGLDPRGGRMSFIYNREFPYNELGMLYTSVDCYVSAGRGEGWDMPLMEAMASGLPCIATDWGAHTQFVTDENAYRLRVKGTIPAVSKCPYYDGFRWADPDPDHLVELMRYIYGHRDEARAKGLAAAEDMRSHHTWDHATANIVRRLREVGA